MIKLIEAYRNDPSLKNATKLVKYADKHPFAVCTLVHGDLDTVDTATKHVREAA